MKTNLLDCAFIGVCAVIRLNMIFFLFLHGNRWWYCGASNEYHNMFVWRNKKTYYMDTATYLELRLSIHVIIISDGEMRKISIFITKIKYM